jgi:hypothetical protein
VVSGGVVLVVATGERPPLHHYLFVLCPFSYSNKNYGKSLVVPFKKREDFGEVRLCDLL